LEKIVEIAHLGFFNKVAGVILRVAIYTLIFSIFLWLINESGMLSPSVKKQSRTYSYLSAVSEYVIDHTSDYSQAVKNIFDDLRHFIANVSPPFPKS
jgi:membrane protein required for colicin V production